MDTRNKQIYRFADVEVDALRGCLRRGGEERRLRPKTFQVLVYLIEHRGGDISKDKLISDVWKDTAVVDDVLVQSIKDIRRALGDDTRRPRFVRTLPKIGYRFIGEVQSLSSAECGVRRAESKLEIKSQKNEAQNSALRTPHSAFRNRTVLLSILLFAVVSIVLGFVGQTAWQGGNRFVSLPVEPGKKSLVVMFFENQSNDAEFDWLREGLADMLIADLSRSDKLNVLSRGQLNVLLGTKGGFTEKLGLDETLGIARRIKADTVATGSFARLGDKLRLEVQLYDVPSGQLRAAESLTVDRTEQILTEIDLLSMKLANRLSAGEIDLDKSTGLAEVMTKNLEAYRYYSLGVEQAQALHNKEAIELFEKAVELDSQFAMAHARIGYAYAVTWNLKEKGKPYLERAFQLSERLTEKDRLNIAAWYAIANLDFQNAAEQFRRIIAKYPLEIEAYYQLARLLQGEGQTEEAVKIIKQGLAIDPEAKNLYNSLGGIMSFRGRHDEAIAAHQRYVALAQNEPNAYDSLGMTYQWAGDYESAIANYNRALELNPNFDVAIVHLANTRFQIGQYREAIALYRRYIENAPSDDERFRGYDSLAAVYLKKRDFNSAEKAAEEAVKIKPEWTWSLYVVAQERGDSARAKALEKTIFDKFPSAGRGGKLPRRPEFYYRGYIRLKNGLSEEAIANFQEAVRDLPLTWNIDAHEDCLANAYLELGQLDEAAAEYERILRLNPNYPLARFHLAQAFERKNQMTEARENYRLFLETWKEADADISEIIAARNSLDKSG